MFTPVIKSCFSEVEKELAVMEPLSMTPRYDQMRYGV